VLLLFGFALPPLVALASVPPLRVLRRDLPRPRAGGLLAYALGAVTIAFLIAYQAREVQAGLIMVGAVAGLLGRRCALRLGLIFLLKKLPSGASRGASASPTCAGARSRRACRSARSRSASWRSCS
jgi:putative ABC transport system permease protein